MKLKIVHLDPEDDHLSARDKIGWPAASHVILVWPRRGKVLNGRLDLVLMKRLADQRSFRLGLISFDPSVRNHATAVDLPLFDSLEEVTEDRWPQPLIPTPPVLPKRPTSKPPAPAPRPFPRTFAARGRQAHGYRWIRVVLVLLGLGSLGLLGIAILPSADVALYPETTRQTMGFSIRLDPSPAGSRQAESIPAQRVTLHLTGEDWIETSGVIRIPETHATGEIVFSNQTEQTRLIPAGTRVRSSGYPQLKFETLQALQLAGGAGQQGSVSVRATEPGEASNLEAHQIDSIEGDLGFQVKVDNPAPLTGGGSTQVASVTQRDVDLLQTSLSTSLVEQATAQLSQSLVAEQALAQMSVQPVRVLSIEVQPAIGEPAAQIRLRLELEIEALIYRKPDLEATVQLLLDQALEDGTAAVPGTVHWRVSESSKVDAPDTTLLSGDADQAIYRIADLHEVASHLPRLEVQAAERFLHKALQLDAPPVIRLRPSWFPGMPWFTNQIDVHWHWENPG